MPKLIDDAPEAVLGASGQPGPRVVRSVSRAMGLLKALAAESRPMSLTDLARTAGLSRPSTFHMLRTLELEGFISKTPAGSYQLDWGLYELGSSVVRSTELTRVARVHLDRVAEASGEAVLLSILDGDSVLYLDRGQAVESFSMVANMGRRNQLHTNASGKVLLAHQSEQFISRVLDHGLVAKTHATLREPQMLSESLSATRLKGHATCWEEDEVGLGSVAVPVRDYTGGVCAAMAIAGPIQRVNARTESGLVELLYEGAVRVSAALGASPE
jgi:DNA-binding IclR family transcriptional regulator